MNNEMDINLTDIFKWHDDNRYENIEGWTSRYVGESLLNIDEKRLSEAEDWIKRAIEVDTKNGTRLSLGHDYALYAEMLKRKGDLSEAKQKLNKAIEIFKECGADGWVKRTQATLKAVSKEG
ncbi:MAG: tetratricopeptide repeat protein [Dehalococcoidia bacterium]|nr:MAG: tetratricopeptide repeat protein [Dehalococcoidia bacterium]